MKNRLVPALLITLVLAAVAAYATAPTLSLSAVDNGRYFWTVQASVSGGTAPYTYEWSLDGGPWVEGYQWKNIFCLPYDTLSGRVTDDNGLVSNVETFTCP